MKTLHIELVFNVADLTSGQETKKLPSFADSMLSKLDKQDPKEGDC